MMMEVVHERFPVLAVLETALEVVLRDARRLVHVACDAPHQARCPGAGSGTLPETLLLLTVVVISGVQVDGAGDISARAAVGAGNDPHVERHRLD